jgi:hypothetical protein
MTFFVATVRPNGRPHSAGVGAVWVDDALYFTSGPGTLKSRNLALNPACSVSVRLRGIDLVLEGEAHRVTDASTWSVWLRCSARAAGRLRWRATRSRPRTARPARAPRLAPVPPHAAHRRRRSRRRAPRRHPLGLRPLTLSRPPSTGQPQRPVWYRAERSSSGIDASTASCRQRGSGPLYAR